MQHFPSQPAFNLITSIPRHPVWPHDSRDSRSSLPSTGAWPSSACPFLQVCQRGQISQDVQVQRPKSSSSISLKAPADFGGRPWMCKRPLTSLPAQFAFVAAPGGAKPVSKAWLREAFKSIAAETFHDSPQQRTCESRDCQLV